MRIHRFITDFILQNSSMITAVSAAVVNIKGVKSHDTVANALTIVETLEHRAGKDAEGKTGDGRRYSASDFSQILQKGSKRNRHYTRRPKEITQ